MEQKRNIGARKTISIEIIRIYVQLVQDKKATATPSPTVASNDVRDESLPKGRASIIKLR